MGYYLGLGPVGFLTEPLVSPCLIGPGINWCHMLAVVR